MPVGRGMMGPHGMVRQLGDPVEVYLPHWWMPECLALWLSVSLNITLLFDDDPPSRQGHTCETRRHGGDHVVPNHMVSYVGDGKVFVSQGHDFMMDLCSVVGQ
jgi:hypothetical protein